MKIEGTPKEIADFIKEIQSQPKNVFVPEDSNGKHIENQPKMNNIT